MVLDAVRGYVQLASGLTEVTKQKAQAAAKALLQQTGADSLTTKASELADEIVATSKSNRQLLQAIVSNEVEGAVARLGFVRSEEVAGLTRRVKALETELAELRAAAAESGAAESGAAADLADADLADADPAADEVLEATAVDAPAAAKKAAAKKAAAPAAEAPAKKAAAKKAAKKAPAKKISKKA
ncbi:polyhydroxyalkanoate synthesis protein PhaF [Kribbella sp. NPDC048915]|uniref:polyhydroxyalkanoate synthesis protein PhaF n=1 Tax=Kribbella sp. NPDC048915 TaxID=3155148 RepID=UPI0033EB8D96